MTDPREETEAARLAALLETGLLDEVPQSSLDRYVRIASLSIGAPVALVSLVDDRRQFFSSLRGLPEPWATQRETPLTHSFCKLVVATRSHLVVEDARRDARVAENLAVRDLGVIAYAGTPIRTSESHVLGSFCVIDDKPRAWTERELALLDELGAAVSEEIEMRRQARRATHSERALAELNRELSEANESVLLASRQAVHDLRTPLGVMSLGLAQLQKHAGIVAFPEVARMLQRLVRNSGHAASLVASLETARSSFPPPPPETSHAADPFEVASDVARDLSTAQRPVSCVGATVGRVAVEPSELRRSIENLVTNALRFASAQVRIVLEEEASYALIHVDDDGPGLPTAQAYERAWQRDVRLHEDSGKSGSGLGLSIVRQIVEHAGGWVKGERSELGGARFSLCLPRTT